MARKGGTPENLKPPFEKGNPGGPGRPKGHKPFNSVLTKVLNAKYKIKSPLSELSSEDKDKEVKAITESLSGTELVVLKLMVKALKGNMRAIEMIRDGQDGKPDQKTTTETMNIDPKSFDSMSDEELAKVEKEIMEKAQK
jgi:hypothetical protein